MKRFVRWLADYLERKFPDQVVVTEATFKALKSKLDDHQFKILELQGCRADNIVSLDGKIALLEAGNIVALKAMQDKLELFERELNKINFAMGFGPVSAKTPQKAAVLER